MYRKFNYKVLFKSMFDNACTDKPGAGKDKMMNIKEWTDFMGALGFTAVSLTFHHAPCLVCAKSLTHFACLDCF